MPLGRIEHDIARFSRGRTVKIHQGSLGIAVELVHVESGKVRGRRAGVVVYRVTGDAQTERNNPASALFDPEVSLATANELSIAAGRIRHRTGSAIRIERVDGTLGVC